ncbi:MAG: zinc-dependent alcohol dehydrogenase family protein [Bacteroidota bacterium]
MKAALFSRPGTLEVVDRSVRSPGAGEILVRIEACGVCGTDLHIVEGSSRSTPPVVLGHEFAGVVEVIGASVQELCPGLRVAVDPNIFCGTCFFCRRGLVHLCKNLRALGVDIDGGMAELCVVPFAQAYRLPDGFPLDAAPFVEPVSCAVHGIDRAGIRSGDTVVILGGGTLGLIILQLARHAGATRTIIVEPRDWKREVARGLGATLAVGPQNAKEAVLDLAPEGADVVIECAGTAASATAAVDLVRRGGTLEFFGVCPKGDTIPVEPHEVFLRELTIVGSFVNPHTFDRAIQLLAAGIVRVDAFRIRRFPVGGVHDALRALKEGETLKSMIVPGA